MIKGSILNQKYINYKKPTENHVSSFVALCLSYSEMRAYLYCWRLFLALVESFAIARAIYSIAWSLAFCERNVFEIV